MDEAKVTEEDGVYVVAGAITFETVTSIYRQFLQVIENQDLQSLTVDFGGITRIDSSVIALLAGVRISAQKHGKEAVFTGLNGGMSSLVSLYGVNWIVDPEQVSAKSPSGLHVSSAPI